MNRSFLFRTCLFIATAIGLIRGTTAFSIEKSCTPLTALNTESAVSTAMFSQGEGYRVIGVRWDPILNQRWAILASCNHPERPSIAMPLTSSRPSASSAKNGDLAQSPFPVIHAGDLVQLWGQEENLRIQIAGRAEQNGATGSKVRVRMLRAGFDEGQERTVVGIVRGPGNVEILR